MNITDEIKESFRQGSVLTRLIYVNIGVFVLVRLINVVFFLMGKDLPILAWLALPADSHVLLTRPWALFTYMFLHFDFLHILFNILWLYWMGKIFLIYFDAKKLLGVYILGGLAGGLFFLAGYNLFPAFADIVSFSRLLGASASVLAIIAAVATYAPNHPINMLFIGQIKMKHLAIFSIILYVIGIAGSNAGGNLAHIGGAVLGFVFVLLLKKGTDLTSGISGLVEWAQKQSKPRSHVKVTYRGSGDPDIDYNRKKNVKQEEVNRVLDKISKSGYDSLSKEEKELLFKMGK